MIHESFDPTNRVAHVTNLVDDCFNERETNDGQRVYAERGMANLYEFLYKILRRDCFPATRKRLEALLIDELNLTQVQVERNLTGITVDQKRKMIQIISESHSFLAGVTYSSRFKQSFIDPDSDESINIRGALMSLLPWTFCRQSCSTSNETMTLMSVKNTSEETPSDGNFCLRISTNMPEDLIHLQGLVLKVTNQDGQLLDKKEITPSGEIVFDLKKIKDEEWVYLDVVEEI